jgi:hypothetical protein
MIVIVGEYYNDSGIDFPSSYDFLIQKDPDEVVVTLNYVEKNNSNDNMAFFNVGGCGLIHFSNFTIYFDGSFKGPFIQMQGMEKKESIKKEK